MRRPLLPLCALVGSLLAQDFGPPPPTMVVEGQVVDMRGEPVPLARISVRERPDGQVLAECVADGQGQFCVARVPKSALCFVVAATDCFRGGAWRRREPKPMRICGHETVTVRGRLCNREGKPVAGSVVRAKANGNNPAFVHSDAVTAADGRFELRGVTLGLVNFAAVVPGEGLARTRLVLGDETEISLAPGTEPTTSMRFQVQGVPTEAMAQVRLEVLPFGDLQVHFPPPWCEPRLEASGSCELLCVPQGQYLVRIAAPGFAFAPQHASLECDQGPHSWTFFATPLGSAELQCRARLLDTDGKPLVGVGLALSAGGESSDATTDAEGRVTFASPVARGETAVVVARGDEWVLNREEKMPFARGPASTWHVCSIDASTTIELRAVPACTVQGRVLLPDGRPAPFVELSLEADQGIARSRFENAITDREGRYRFPSLHHGDTAIRVVVEGVHGSSASEPLSIAMAGTKIEVPDLRLREPAVIEGTVRNAQGKPLGGLRISLSTGDAATVGRRATEVVTDRRGRYRFLGVPVGLANLEVLLNQIRPSGESNATLEIDAGQIYVRDLVSR